MTPNTRKGSEYPHLSIGQTTFSFYHRIAKFLKDAVCSPAGTTIEAVRVLEEKGMRSAVIEATIAASKKSKEMGK